MHCHLNGHTGRKVTLKSQFTYLLPIFSKYTVDMVIFACLNFRKFLILELFTKFRTREFSFFFSNAIKIIILAKLLNSRIYRPHEIRECYQIYSISIELFTLFNIQCDDLSYLIDLTDSFL